MVKLRSSSCPVFAVKLARKRHHSCVLRVLKTWVCVDGEAVTWNSIAFRMCKGSHIQYVRTDGRGGEGRETSYVYAKCSYRDFDVIVFAYK